MTSITRRTIEIAAFITVLLTAAMTLHAWLASRDEQTRLASTLAAQKQIIDAADARENTRQSALKDALAQIDNLKRTTLTPEQILRALPQYLALPQPITLVTPRSSTGAAPPPNGAQEKGTALSAEFPSVPTTDLPPPSAAASPAAAGQSAATRDLPSAPVAQIPAADLKPLYNYVQDCRACQAQLAAAKQDKLDDSAKIISLQRQRDAAVKASKGGTFWRQLRRNALWFAAGAAAGAAVRIAPAHPRTT